MFVIDIKVFPDAYIVKVNLEAPHDRLMPHGRQKITPRLRAAAKQLADQNMLEECTLIQIDAGAYEYSHIVGRSMQVQIYDQEVTFYFSKNHENHNTKSL